MSTRLTTLRIPRRPYRNDAPPVMWVSCECHANVGFGEKISMAPAQ